MEILTGRCSFTVIALFVGLFVSSCGDHTDKTGSNREPVSDSMVTPVPLKPLVPEPENTQVDSLNEVMDAKDIRLNGKLERYFILEQFKTLIGKPDSTRLLSADEPCTTIFEGLDGAVDPQAKYLYKNGSRYENTGNKVAIDKISFTHGDFITFRNKTLNGSTTLDDLRKLFPNAVKHINVMNVHLEGKLQAFYLREDKDNISDGHIIVFIKNSKLYALDWWFPC